MACKARRLMVWVEPIDEGGSALAVAHRRLNCGRRLIRSLRKPHLLSVADRTMRIHLSKYQTQVLLSDRQWVVGLVVEDAPLAELRVAHGLVNLEV